MVYPILPLYLTSVFGASPAIIGSIEGIAESLASILKLVSGMIADKYDNKKQLAFVGYLSSFFNKIIILLSASWGVFCLHELLTVLGRAYTWRREMHLLRGQQGISDEAILRTFYFGRLSGVICRHRSSHVICRNRSSHCLK